MKRNASGGSEVQDVGDKINFEISRCQWPCRTCNRYQTYYCITCYDNDALIQRGFREKYSCQPTCGDGYYKSFGECHECPSLCRTCLSPAKCESCFSENYKSGNFCVEKCEEGTYLDPYRTCQYCNDLCRTCKGDSYYCTGCYSGYYLEQRGCLKCSILCKECSKKDDCTACNEGLFLHADTKMCLPSE